MLEYEMSKQSERRGRFLIQEIEDDCDYTPIKNHFSTEKMEKVEKNNLISTHPCGSNNNHSKRPKHSSIIMDSKIIHTTRMDSNYYCETFSTLIYEESTKDWVDFEHIWKGFSKVHVDVVEDDMEKIFHYIDTKIDDSDFFCVKNLNTLHEPENLLPKLRSDDKLITFDKIKINSDMDMHTSITCSNIEKKIDSNTNVQSIMYLDNKSEQKIICPGEAEKKIESNPKGKKLKNKKNKNRSLILTNFCCPSIVSPPISPINSSREEEKIIYGNKKYSQYQLSEKGNQSRFKLESFNLQNNIYVEKFNFEKSEEFKNEKNFKGCHTESEIFKNFKKKISLRNINIKSSINEENKENKGSRKNSDILKDEIQNIFTKTINLKNNANKKFERFQISKNTEFSVTPPSDLKNHFQNNNLEKFTPSRFSIINSNNLEIKNTIEESYFAGPKIPEDGPRCCVCRSKVIY
jgi:hypothetical protein